MDYHSRFSTYTVVKEKYISELMQQRPFAVVPIFVTTVPSEEEFSLCTVSNHRSNQILVQAFIIEVLGRREHPSGRDRDNRTFKANLLQLLVHSQHICNCVGRLLGGLTERGGEGAL